MKETYIYKHELYRISSQYDMMLMFLTIQTFAAVTDAHTTYSTKYIRYV